jgi:hypothetical protein
LAKYTYGLLLPLEQYHKIEIKKTHHQVISFQHLVNVEECFPSDLKKCNLITGNHPYKEGKMVIIPSKI